MNKTNCTVKNPFSLTLKSAEPKDGCARLCIAEQIRVFSCEEYTDCVTRTVDRILVKIAEIN